MENILIVEDELIIAMELETRIKQFGYQIVGTAVTGRQAISMSKKLNPDLIMMDVNIKGDLDGVETAKEILKTQKVPIIFATAYSDKHTTDRIKLAKPYGLLFKPISEKDLEATIDLALYKFNMEKTIVEREEALRESEEKYKSITQSSLDLIFILDKKGKLLFFNDRLETMLGYKVDEVLGCRFTQYIPYEEVSSFANQVKKIFNNEVVTYFVTRIKHKNGNPVDVEINGRLVKHKGELAIQGAIRDISDRLKATRLLAESERSYESLFNSVTESIFVHGADGVIENVNVGTVKMYGYSREELLGKTPAFFSAPGKNDLNNIAEFFETVFKTGKSINFEFWGKKKSGEIFLKEVMSSKSKYFGKDVIISTARDVSERRKNEMELRESEDRFREVYENVSIGIYRTTPEGEIILANPALVKILGFSSLDELKERKLSDGSGYVNPKKREEFKRLLSENGELINFVVEWKTKNGGIVVINECAKAVKDSNGNVIYYDGTVENITHLKLS